MSDFAVELRDPRDIRPELTDLFARNGQPRFEEVFERAYRPRAEDGLRSWVGRAEGRIVMHVAVHPLTLRRAGAEISVGVMGDLMVEDAFRDFWAPARLLRTVVADTKRDGEFAFLATTTTSQAESVFKAAGFKLYGIMRRHVMPLYRPYLLWSRLRARKRACPVRQMDAAVASHDVASLHSGDYWRPVASPEYYATRFERTEFFDGTWIGVGEDGDARVLLSRNRTLPELSLADAFWDAPRTDIGELALAAARWTRTLGLRRLSVTTLGGTRASEQLVRAGFVDRSARSHVLVRELTSAPPPLADCFLTAFPLSAW